MPVNPLIRKPRPPGRWVNYESCICGARYNDLRCGVGFGEAAQMLRIKAEAAGDITGGYRSRGPVLWLMRVSKLDAWFSMHFDCGRNYRGGRQWKEVKEIRAASLA